MGANAALHDGAECPSAEFVQTSGVFVNQPLLSLTRQLHVRSSVC